MRRRLRSGRARREPGSAVVEFAVAIVPAITLLTGLVDLWAYDLNRARVREMAREAALAMTDAGDATAAVAAAQQRVDEVAARQLFRVRDVRVSVAGSGFERGQLARVQVDGQHAFLLLGGTARLSASASTYVPPSRNRS